MASTSARSALLISQPSAPRFSLTSAGARKPTSAVPTTGLLSVQRNANCGRLLPYLVASGFSCVRYWNMARQRYSHPSARCCRILRVSADRAARPGPHTGGKPRLVDLGRRIPARDRFAPDSPLEEGGFETSVPRIEDDQDLWRRSNIIEL